MCDDASSSSSSSSTLSKRFCGEAGIAAFVRFNPTLSITAMGVHVSPTFWQGVFVSRDWRVRKGPSVRVDWCIGMFGISLFVEAELIKEAFGMVEVCRTEDTPKKEHVTDKGRRRAKSREKL